jgi:hypothetical protein
MLILMRTEKIGLRDFLYQRRVPEITDPHCVCGEGRQTVMHVLMRCRRFQDLRRQELSGIPFYSQGMFVDSLHSFRAQ